MAPAPDELQVTAAATFCATLVDEWRRLGMDHAVVSPGSRSSPMALALADATATGAVQLHVVLDERSAAYLALGIARVTRTPVPVLTTSGTATANLHPAVVEAHHDGVPLVCCTADRPPELHGVGAPQTIDQRHLFGPAVRAYVDAGVPDETDPATWRALADEVWTRAGGSRPGTMPGPVQLNLPFREPLVGRPGALPNRGVREPVHAPNRARPDGLERLDGARVLVVLGPPCPGDERVRLLERAASRGWPVLVDPRCRRLPGEAVVGASEPGGSGAPAPAEVARRRVEVHRADLLLRSPGFVERARPDVVLRIGALPASKVLGAWLDQLDAWQVGIDPWGRRFDPDRSLDELWAHGADVLSLDDPAPAPAGWADLWTSADDKISEVLERELGAGPLTEPAVARMVTAAARDHEAELVVSSSMPIRDVEWFGVADGPAIRANRGANGIDGVTSMAVGVALGSDRPTFALLGDLAFLHDSTGLLALRGERPDLTLVVVDNGGGGIFHFLPQHSALDAARFEALYGTPQPTDLAALARAHGLPVEYCGDRPSMEATLAFVPSGPRVVVVETDRQTNVAEHRRLQDAAVAAVEVEVEVDQGRT